MGILTWIVVGLVAGALAKLIMPGPDKGGWIMTIILGIVGAFVGGFVGNLLGLGGTQATGFNIPTLLTATGGAIIILFLYRTFSKP
ncbi:GlsB/YeaQ/YmgE family stress response membrane protein [Kangiella geojedonensis]|uniref:Putative transglycosylase associated protein n=1 Tax=Kangiella geojedonensis TaxID=914150 RepID=A0A0F6TQY1_9GAMM|nr:GlsB/YeaQ/YmgE family stress response membrane protein [Kangiella geojedonensis]AKE52102.1 Putative transglycosylase associated protein [Kangiella geojedonensis]